MHSQLQESGDLEFKEKFDPDNNGEWCEIIKYAVAIANSGGGKIIFGLKNDDSPSREDILAALKIDKAKITDKIARYTGEQFGDFSIKGEIISEHEVVVWEIGGVYIPMVFTKPGTYDVGGGQQKSAFSQGSVYFRHGAKSEPGTSEDLRAFLEREVERIKESWLKNIRKVVEAPPGTEVEIVLPNVAGSPTPSATTIRLVDDPSAPAYVW